MGPKRLRPKYPLNWREISEQRKKEAGYRCEWCGRKESKKRGFIIDTHHLDGNPLNNKPENTPVLCRRCHARGEQRGNLKQLWFEGMKPDWAKDKEEFYLNLRKAREEDY